MNIKIIRSPLSVLNISNKETQACYNIPLTTSQAEELEKVLGFSDTSVFYRAKDEWKTKLNDIAEELNLDINGNGTLAFLEIIDALKKALGTETVRFLKSKVIQKLVKNIYPKPDTNDGYWTIGNDLKLNHYSNYMLSMGEISFLNKQSASAFVDLMKNQLFEGDVII